MDALSNDDYRHLLERPDMTDAEIDELRESLCQFLSTFLDEFFRERFEREGDL